MTGFLNAISNFYFRAHRSKVFTIATSLILLTCVALLAAARPNSQEDLKVYELNDNTSLASSIDHYFNIRGQLKPEARYQSQVRSGSFRFAGSAYVLIQIDTRTEPIFVLDQDIPAPKADGTVSFVGRLSTVNDPVVNYFLEVDSPTNVPLINRLANIGMGVGLLTLLVLGMGALVSRKDYALSTNAGGAATARWAIPSAQSSNGLWWFGNLGARYQNATARQSPVQLNTAAHNFTLESLGKDPWTITIKRTTQTQPAYIATASGPLPALRLRFEDERGLLRQGVLVMSDEAARQEFLRRLTQQ
jgi:hypothetical protein